MKFTNLKASSFLLGELEHPNKMPFSGILTYFDVPSDMAPHGSNGRKVLIPSDVGVPALDSLIGMAVNLIEGAMDDHDPQSKIGVITSAEAGESTGNGVPVYIQGYIYANDFPSAALDIKLNQSALGFSYETTNTLLMDGTYEDEPVAVVTQVVFTGASILYAADAAYTTTTLAASAETENNEKEGNLSMEQVEQILAAIQGLKEYVDTKFDNFKQEDDIEDAVADALEDLQESVEVQASAEEVVEPVEEVVEEAPVEEEEVEESEEEEDTQETELNAAAELKAELDRVKAELAEIKASADLHASARKSVAYPVTLMAKYQLSEEEEATTLMASIDNNDDLSIEERWALKLELLEKKRKESK